MNLEYKTGLFFVRVKNTYLCGMFLRSWEIFEKFGEIRDLRSDGEFLSQVTKLNERLGNGINKVFNVYHSDSTHSLCKFDRCANVVESMRESSFLARLL